MKTHKQIKTLAKEYSDVVFRKYNPDAILDPKITFYSGFKLGYQMAYDEVNYEKNKNEVLEETGRKKRKVTRKADSN